MIELIPIIVRQQQLRLPRIVCIYNRERVMVGGAHTLCAIGCPRVAYGLIILHVRHSPLTALTFRIPLRTRKFPGMYLVMARHARGAPPASSPPPQYSCQYLWQCCAPICAHVPFTVTLQAICRPHGFARGPGRHPHYFGSLYSIQAAE